MKNKNKVILKIDGLSLIDKAFNLTISYNEEEDMLYMTPMFNKDINVDIDYKKFMLFLKSNQDADRIAYLGAKRFLENEQIEMLEIIKAEDHKNYLQITAHSDRYLNIDLNTIIYYRHLLNYIWKQLGKDFGLEYTKNKDKINKIYIYDSEHTTSFKYIDKDKSLYITNNYKNNLINVDMLIEIVLDNYNKDKTPNNYTEDDNKILLDYSDDKRIIIYNKKYKNNYKNVIEQFQNDLIDVKTKVYKLRREDKNE